MSIRRKLLAALLGVVGLSLATPAFASASPTQQTSLRSTHQGKKSARKKRVKKEAKPKESSKKDGKKKDVGFEM